MPNYETKSDLKGEGCIDTSKFARKADVGSLKLNIDKLGIGKLKATPFNLSKLSNVVKTDVVKKIVYDKLVKQI